MRDETDPLKPDDLFADFTGLAAPVEAAAPAGPEPMAAPTADLANDQANDQANGQVKDQAVEQATEQAGEQATVPTLDATPAQATEPASEAPPPVPEPPAAPRRAREPQPVLDPFPALAAEPYRYDFFHALRWIEAAHPLKPRLGTGRKPADEPLRVGQAPDLGFAPATLHALQPATAHRPPRLDVRFFGLFGPNGPLPLHLTEYARERILHHGDETFARFADVLHHRLALLFYRAWAQAQPTVNLDRPAQDRFADYVGSLIGIGSPTLRGRDAAPDHIKLHFAGRLARQVRNAEGLEALLSGYLQQPVRIETFVGHWMSLPLSERTRMERGGSVSSQLGSGAVLGGRVFDRQHKFRIHIGPLSLAQYEAFLPDGPAMAGLTALVRQYFCGELDWDVRLHLKRAEVPTARPGAYGRLGWTSWVGKNRRREAAGTDEDSLTLHPESWRAPRRHAAPSSSQPST
jgi:type VI secretion system protein ImpH